MGHDSSIACKIVRGHVQGVGFRNFAQSEAVRAQITGWVRNTSGGDVEIHAQGSQQNMSAFIIKLQQGSTSSQVENIVTENLVNLEEYNSFEIRY